MASQFDPYLEWLKIPLDQQPPNHYRLLGLKPLESDPMLIESAVDRLVERMQQLSHGPQVESAQKILNHVAQARLCLNDRNKKLLYDQQLKSKLSNGTTRDISSDAKAEALKSTRFDQQRPVSQKTLAKTTAQPPESPVSKLDGSVDLKLKQMKIATVAMLLLGAIVGTAFVWFVFGGSSRSTSRSVRLAQNSASQISDNSTLEEGELQSRTSLAIDRERATSEDAFARAASAASSNLGMNSPKPTDETQKSSQPEVNEIPASTTPPTPAVVPEPLAPILQNNPSNNPPEPGTNQDTSAPEPVPGQSGVYYPAKPEVFFSMVGDVIGLEGQAVAGRTSSTGKTVYLMFATRRNELIEIRARATDINLESISSYAGKKVCVRGPLKEEFGSKTIGLEISTVEQIEIIE